MDRYTDQGFTEPENNRSSFNQKSKDDLKHTAQEAGKNIRNESRVKAESAKGKAADQLDEYRDVTESIAKTLHDEHHETLSTYVSEIAGYVSNISTGLREKSADDLMRDAKNMARQNPALFIAGSVAIGLGIARLARTGVEQSTDRKSSADRNYTSVPENTDRTSGETGLDSDATRSEDDSWPEQKPYTAGSSSSAGTDSLSSSYGNRTSDSPSIIKEPV